ncbi:MAG: hypothetical protein ACXVXO_09910 [Mycobacteriaceae bacterium]
MKDCRSGREHSDTRCTGARSGKRCRRGAASTQGHVSDRSRCSAEATIRTSLTEALDAARKQRHTARRIWQRLREEKGAVVAESSVRNLVAELNKDIGAGAQQVMVPQTHSRAQEAEVDFREFTGVVMKLFMSCTVTRSLAAAPVPCGRASVVR